MKDGSGDLNFGEDDDSDDDEETESKSSSDTGSGSIPSRHTESDSTPTQSRDSDRSTGPKSVGGRQTGSSVSDTAVSDSKYPYFVRRSNVGDERDKRLEVHVREEVTEREAEFRAALAEELGVSEISKTDAREFALLAAFEDPEGVAEQMREDGFGEVG